MNYERIYAALIYGAQCRQRKKGLGIYFEKHHILPQSAGGTSDRSNLVLLTAKEHFVAHHLLFKAHQHSAPIQRAFWMMCNSPESRATGKVTPRLYERTRIEVARKFRHSEEAVEKIRRTSTGRRHTPAARERIGAASSARVASGETRVKIAAAKKGHVKAAETLAKVSAALRGRVKSVEHREKLRQAGLGAKSHRFGLHWFTDGRTNVMAKECPAGFGPGRVTKGF